MLLRFDMQFMIVEFILLFGIINKVYCECGIAAPPVNNGYGIEPDIFPWHVLIYEKSENSSYSQKCAGTLIKPDTVISAAHCFYNEIEKTISNTSNFKVAAGKYFIPYNWRGIHVQKLSIKEINLINGYRGSEELFSKDIASIILEKPFNITTFVKPVCTDFDNIEDTRNLRSGEIGKTAGCKRYRNGKCSAQLRDSNFSFIPRDQCKSMMPESRRSYITNDKFCATCLNDEIGLSSTDSGSGLHFQHNGKWYLHGVLSFVNDSDVNYSGINPIVFSDFKNFNYELTNSKNIIKCGTTPAISEIGNYIIDGFKTERGQYPWHVAIYLINELGIYDQICSGSLINPNVVISAAHCFWNDTIAANNNVSNYAIAAGKYYRMYYRPERYAQTSEIREIYIPKRYFGGAALQADDISWLILKHPMTITDFVRPVCLDMNNNYQMEDLRVGRIGRAAGWGFTMDREPSMELMQIQLPYIDFDQCRSTFPQDFKPYITYDKFCAGYTNGSSLCNGDSGGGIVFQREGQWYLRGIVSSSPTNNGTCDNNYYTVFTNVGKFQEDLYRFMNYNFNDTV